MIRDRLSFMRFLGLGLEDAVPDAKTIWLFREGLKEKGVVDPLFDRFDRHLEDKGMLALGGQIMDASVVEAQRQRDFCIMSDFFDRKQFSLLFRPLFHFFRPVGGDLGSFSTY